MEKVKGLRQKWPFFLLGLLLALLFLFLSHHFFHRKIYQFDGMLYVHAGYALSQGMGKEAWDLLVRSPVVPLFIALFFSIDPSPSLTSLPYLSLFFLGCSVLALYFTYQLFRNHHISSFYALLGVLLLSGNRFFLHYGGEPMTDILATLLTLITARLYETYCHQKRPFILFLCGIYLGVLFATRQVLALVSVAFFVTHLWHSRNQWKTQLTTTVWELASLSLLPLFVGASLYGFIPLLLGKSYSLFFFFQFQLAHYFHKPFTFPFTDIPWEGWIYLISGGGLGLIFFFLWGVYFNIKDTSLYLAYSITAISLFCFPLLWSHHEGRYYLFSLPFVYLLALKGLTRIKLRLRKLLCTLWLISALLPFVQEIYTLQEPFLRESFYQKVVQEIQKLEKEFPTSELYYAHRYYALYPSSYPQWYHMSIYDEFYHFYHFFRYPLAIELKTAVRRIPPSFFPFLPHREVSYSPNPPWQIFIRNPLRYFSHGSVILYGPPWLDYSAHISKERPPLLITQLRTEMLYKREKKWQGEKVNLQNNTLNSPFFPVDLYLRSKEKQKIWLGTGVSPHTFLLPNYTQISLEKLQSSLPNKAVLLAVYPHIIPIKPKGH